jgi:protein-disulfide isomerase
MTKYKACTEDPAVAAEIKDSIKQGEAVGVSGTPAFFINGRMLSGAQPMSAFEEVIQQEL